MTWQRPALLTPHQSPPGGTWGTPHRALGNARWLREPPSGELHPAPPTAPPSDMTATTSQCTPPRVPGACGGAPRSSREHPVAYGVLNGVSCTPAPPTATAVSRVCVPTHLRHRVRWRLGRGHTTPSAGRLQRSSTGVSCASAVDCTAVRLRQQTACRLCTPRNPGACGARPTDVSGAPGGGGLFGSVSCAKHSGLHSVEGSDGNNQPMYRHLGGRAPRPLAPQAPAQRPDAGVPSPSVARVTWTYQVTNTGNVQHLE